MLCAHAAQDDFATQFYFCVNYCPEDDQTSVETCIHVFVLIETNI
jgi:hypothetical protein